VDVAYVLGSPEYIALMRDLSTNPNRLDLPTLETVAQQLRYAQKKVERQANLLLGRPGSPNAGTLSAMLTKLRRETESYLTAQNVTTVGITVSNAAPASLEEINDALTHSRMEKLDKRQVPDRELNSAYGSYGFGLCTSYTDPYACEEEEAAFGIADSVLHLDYTRKTLAANTHVISSARSTYVTTQFVDWTLGRDAASGEDGGGDYWDALRLRIGGLTGSVRHPYTKILLTGDCAGDEKFLEILRDIFGGSMMVEPVDVRKTIDFKFVAARGAAEFQRRRQRGWLNCVQPKRCGEPTSILGKMRDQAQRVLEL
jgi:hypothetical protein